MKNLSHLLFLFMGLSLSNNLFCMDADEDELDNALIDLMSAFEESDKQIQEQKRELEAQSGDYVKPKPLAKASQNNTLSIGPKKARKKPERRSKPKEVLVAKGDTVERLTTVYHTITREQARIMVDRCAEAGAIDALLKNSFDDKQQN